MAQCNNLNCSKNRIHFLLILGLNVTWTCNNYWTFGRGVNEVPNKLFLSSQPSSLDEVWYNSAHFWVCVQGSTSQQATSQSSASANQVYYTIYLQCSYSRTALWRGLRQGDLQIKQRCPVPCWQTSLLMSSNHVCLSVWLKKLSKIVVCIGQRHISLPVPLKMVSDWSDKPNLWPPALHHKSWSEQDWDLYMAIIDLITFHYMENYRNAKSFNHFQFSRILFIDRKRPWSENAPLGVFFFFFLIAGGTKAFWSVWGFLQA